MSQDLLVRAARALRDAHDGTSPRSAATGDRVLALARRRARTGRRVTAFAAALAAVLVVATAWAATTGRLPAIAAWLRRSSPAPRRDAEAMATASTAPVVTRLPSASQVEDEPRAPAASATTAAVVVSAPHAALPSSATPTAAAPVKRDQDAEQAQDAEQQAYAVAHQAHFVARDPAAALRGWDAYLAAFPAGRFALEARYNRGLSLIRLGRFAEGRAALAPFADGAAGGYRQTEARELLEAIAGR